MSGKSNITSVINDFRLSFILLRRTSIMAKMSNIKTNTISNAILILLGGKSKTILPTKIEIIFIRPRSAFAKKKDGIVANGSKISIPDIPAKGVYGLR